jgi:hypothetical protein
MSAYRVRDSFSTNRDLSDMLITPVSNYRSSEFVTVNIDPFSPQRPSLIHPAIGRIGRPIGRRSIS